MYISLLELIFVRLLFWLLGLLPKVVGALLTVGWWFGTTVVGLVLRPILREAAHGIGRRRVRARVGGA